jgi:hypothetical protein
VARVPFSAQDFLMSLAEGRQTTDNIPGKRVSKRRRVKTI